MATRSLRHRSSRYSSPATFVDKDAAPKPAEGPLTRNGQQSSLDSWIEPTVRTAVPSFEDTKGLERLGVLENMQPLGTAPSQRLLQKLKLNYVRPSPRATPLQAEEVVTPVAEPEKMDFASPLEDPEPEAEADERQGGFLPEPPPPHLRRPSDTITISSPPRGRPPRREVAEMAQAENVSPSSVNNLSFTPPSHSTPKPHSIQEHLRQDRLQNHVERAVQEAHQKSTPDLVPGLEKLREDAQRYPELWNVLEAVVHKSPTSSQFRTFKRYIKSGIKRYRRASEISASPYQSSPQRLNNAFTSPNHLQHSPRLSQSHSNSVNHPEEPRRRLHLYFNMPPGRAIQDLEEPLTSPMNYPRTVEVGDSREASSQQAVTMSPHKRKRSQSVSSMSSLSSAPSIPDEMPPFPSRGQHGDGRTGSGRSRSSGQRQAASRGATAASRLRSAASATNHQSNSTSKQSYPDAAAAVKANTGNKKSRKSRDEPEFDIDELSRRKRTLLDDSFHDYNTIPRPESNERGLAHSDSDRAESNERPLAPVVHPNRLAVSRSERGSSVNTLGQSVHVLPNGTSRKRAYDEIDPDEVDAITPESSSPGPLLVPPPPPGMANVASRGATPRATRLQPTAKTRKSARVMVSPNKPKNGGITAGISRAGGGRDTAMPGLNGADSGAEDNDEFCASCGGEGKLLCCDGCTNSFHHACLEPPLNPEEEVEGEWFCPRCVARRTKAVPHPTGLLGMVIRRVDDTIPKAFALPIEIRDYFEGVRTGDEGEYEEVGLPRTQNNAVKMNRAGFIEEPNYKELRDSKGNIIRCYLCGLTSNGRDIIPCDFCPARWHLDCLDPPLAVPPRRRGGDKPSASWRCPLHVEHDLLTVGRQAEAAPGDLGRVPRVRKPKNAVPLDIPVTRGFRNNGVIEIELMKELPTLDQTKEVEMHGKVHRIPEEGIRLDFIDRVKKSWYEDHSFPKLMDGPKRIRNRKYRPDGAVLHHPPEQTLVKIREPDFFTGANALAITETAKANAALRKRSIKEQQTVLNLAEMSQKGIDGYSGDALAELTNHLISEAPTAVVDAVERTEIDQLLQLQRLIQKRLSILNHPDSDTPLLSVEQDIQEGAAQSKSLPPVRDPNIDPALRMAQLDADPSTSKMLNGDKAEILAEGAVQQQYEYEDASVEDYDTGSDGDYDSSSHAEEPYTKMKSEEGYGNADTLDYGDDGIKDGKDADQADNEMQLSG